MNVARLPRGSEAPVADGVGDFLGRPSGEGDFEIVDDPRPVQGQALDPAAFHQVDEDGLKADLDDVGAAPEQDGLPLPMGLAHQSDELTEIPAGQDAGKRVEENGDVSAPSTGLANAAATTLLRRPRRDRVFKSIGRGQRILRHDRLRFGIDGMD